MKAIIAALLLAATALAHADDFERREFDYPGNVGQMPHSWYGTTTVDGRAEILRTECRTDIRQYWILRREIQGGKYIPIKRLDNGACAIAPGVGVVTDEYSRENLRVDSDTTIDHIVPLKEAWESGASRWAAERRSKFANDTDNFRITSRAINAKKGDLPVDRFSDWAPAKVNRCSFAEQYATIKRKYGLSFTKAEVRYYEELYPKCRFELVVSKGLLGFSTLKGVEVR